MKPLAKVITQSLAALGLAGAAVTPALAGTMPNQGVVRTVTVPTHDLDLGTATGQRVLDNRVERAVRSVCRTTSLENGSRTMSQDALNCLAKARADARQQVAALVSDEQRGG